MKFCAWCMKPIQVQIYKGERYCCDNHRKLLEGDAEHVAPSR